MRSEVNIAIIKIWLRKINIGQAQTKHNNAISYCLDTEISEKRVLESKLSKRLEELLRECADVNRWNIDELNIKRDHVQMLVQLRPEISVSKVLQLLKGKSSYIIRKESPHLTEFFWGKAEIFWGDGFFVETIGQVNESKIKEYIRNQ